MMVTNMESTTFNNLAKLNTCPNTNTRHVRRKNGSESRTRDLMRTSSLRSKTILYFSDIILKSFCSSALSSKDTLSSYVMGALSVLMCFVILTAHGATTYTVGGGRTMQFGVVIDAGSSGSRVRVYGWTRPPGHHGAIPQFGEAYNFKVRPGISAYNTPNKNLSELDAYIEELLRQAINFVPLAQHYETPIYVMATAGKSDVILLCLITLASFYFALLFWHRFSLSFILWFELCTVFEVIFV